MLSLHGEYGQHVYTISVDIGMSGGKGGEQRTLLYMPTFILFNKIFKTCCSQIIMMKYCNYKILAMDHNEQNVISL